MSPWRSLHLPKQIDVVSPSGELRCTVDGYGGNDSIIIDDVKNADVRVGDEIRLPLPNGREDVFTVVDPKFFETKSGFPAHYQVRLRRKDSFPRHQGGHYDIKVSGDGARVNISSSDSSTNIVGDNVSFDRLRDSLSSSGLEHGELISLIRYIDDIKHSETKQARATAFQKLIAASSSCMPIITPFLPFLTRFVDGGASSF